MLEEKARIEELRRRISAIMEHLDIAGKEKQLFELEARTSDPGFWSDQQTAQSVMRQIGALKDTVSQWRDIEKKAVGVEEVISIALAENDESLKADVRGETDRMEARFNDIEVQLMLDGPYDSRDAILAIHAGAGGTESQDWAQMLMRMFLRWCERRKLQSDVLDISPGDEAGIKSATIEIKGNFAYGNLKSEHGVHRLVRLSPFDADHARHTSFALVEVMPEAEARTDLQISPEDIRVDTFRSSGPGGQHMQKTSSAVRITHIPTGLVVSCQSERSQHQNKESALRVLYARLLEKEIEKREAEQAKIKGKRIDAGWGNQIRSYVLHPYKMVKDHRTEHETSNTAAVLDGEIDEFINAYLRSKVGEGK
ncbi:MAG: peptide chain release factor 2 [Dehalococcoidia bacterium]|nr:MAG: peptide chain release factor 2 [Dehalococcoidia bacterium]